MDRVSASSMVSCEPIPCSGLYTVTHEAHELPLQVPLLAGNRFPQCAECGRPVYFTLVRRMPHLDKLKGNTVVNTLPVVEKDAA